ncbi:MAG: methylmalonyl-CoA mutase family protein [Alphaproteobacteria bacterium]|nr:methylmalonyl-CoA mutase family protein [Alphaproteobacteria bacterium]MDE2011909.1 methylmalonyl-CoA mutase family protein [Alphaproteobacteria bacterium]MDE2073924.1 methylmalonyl-CoA mutase family protein [Alphaproteobacteria bacterium]
MSEIAVSQRPRAGKAAAGRQSPKAIRFVTATSLFDGHDAAINIMRRLLQQAGAEVIHLGHNRSVEEIVTAAIQEDVQGIAVSSYQGGHIEFFKYMIDLLRERGAGHIKVFGGGGGVIVAPEIRELEAYGVARIYSPEDGHNLGLEGMIADMIARADLEIAAELPKSLDDLAAPDRRILARLISGLENGTLSAELTTAIAKRVVGHRVPVLGITGTGGAGKSSLTDELIRRFRLDVPEFAIAVIAVDPSRRKTGGALLGDRIRMNAVNGPIFMRSLATRDSVREVPDEVPAIIELCRAAGFDLVMLETPGIGQGDAAVCEIADLSLYVMTPEFGAASQLEKIEMLDHADLVAINKFDRRGGHDALRDVRKQMQRNRKAFSEAPDTMPVYGTIASRFNDDGVTALYLGLLEALGAKGFAVPQSAMPRPAGRESTAGTAIVPAARVRYLAEISETVRGYHRAVGEQARLAREAQQLRESARMLSESGKDANSLIELASDREAKLDPHAHKLIADWPAVKESYAGDAYVVKIRDKELRTKIVSTTLSGTRIPKVVLPRYQDHGELLKWLMKENLPGSFPYTAGVFAFKRENEDPTRMFAGEGDAFRTNARFKLLSKHAEAKRLSTAFDSVTLYGCDPDERPDIYGKIGNSGVSIATLDDMKVLYSGFDLCAPSTSVSMTINGPAPVILAMFFNTAIDQQIDKFRCENHREPSDDEVEKIREWTLETVRGTVQADILKEDQGQNTCIFSTDFALKLMGDVQEYFVHNQVRNFYSVSISGYHIAEAGANPISQLAFTLANGFTYVESYLARGMHIDDFAPNLSFFFSNGMDPEYAVIGRVARRIWAAAMRYKYKGNERSQKLKYHIQTSGRSLHAQEIDFNDIRTTLQALIAIYDNCNSLHTNAHDEAYTTPTAESVRRAMAIQLIINREWGLARNENPNQGAFIIDELTDLVEEAVLTEFDRIAERGGVLGAMETGYQRGKIQDESLYYEHKKHDGSYPIVGVNTFLNPEGADEHEIVLQRSSDEEKQSQLRRLREFHARNTEAAPAALARLRAAAIANENLFAVLMDTVRSCSLGQITEALYQVGGQYRRNM